MFVGVRPTTNVSSSNTNQYRDWHRLTLLTDNLIDLSSKSHASVVIDDTVAWNAGTGKTKASFSQESVSRMNFPTFTDTVDTIQLQAHGIQIFSTLDGAFFRDYMPYTFGGTNIVTPEDKGAFMMNFCLYPGTYQPSGHFNVSRAREFFITLVSSYVGTASATGDLIVLAIAINFLLISTIRNQKAGCFQRYQVPLKSKQFKLDWTTSNYNLLVFKKHLSVHTAPAS